MRILVTGNAGYIGSVLGKYLRGCRVNTEMIGYDNGYFAHCLTDSRYLPEFDYDHQYWGDLRDFPFELLDDIDVVIPIPESSTTSAIQLAAALDIKYRDKNIYEVLEMTISQAISFKICLGTPVNILPISS